jgi:hypothetical protein
MERQKRKCFGKVILSFTALSLAFTLNACGGKSDREDSGSQAVLYDRRG